ncbi:glycoside hydrolase family 75 protein [Streptomyces bacillaris]|uniref:glycoside hydrolase family 75 protein n=1 Tax=Streptomyces bacillaris TaxID=68179 RepID=UPI0034615EFA
MRTRTFALTAVSSAVCGAALLGPAALPATATPHRPAPDTAPGERAAFLPGAWTGEALADQVPGLPADIGAEVPTEAPTDASGDVPVDARADVPAEGTAGVPADDAPVTAEELLAEVRSCRQISQGKYRTDANSAKATVPVCATTDAVFWKADMDIDCDGRRTKVCNKKTDPYFQPQTAFTSSRGKPLDSAALPFVVVPAPSRTWDYRKSGLTGGSVVAVIYEGKVRYAVIGDTGPAGIIGEGSYALAEELSVDPHPTTGGAASGVTYIAFKDSRISPIESRATAESRGEELARAFVGR